MTLTITKILLLSLLQISSMFLSHSKFTNKLLNEEDDLIHYQDVHLTAGWEWAGTPIRILY
jgi:hypothetical protein